jgi:hypothetical protein
MPVQKEAHTGCDPETQKAGRGTQTTYRDLTGKSDSPHHEETGTGAAASLVLVGLLSLALGSGLWLLPLFGLGVNETMLSLCVKTRLLHHRLLCIPVSLFWRSEHLTVPLCACSELQPHKPFGVVVPTTSVKMILRYLRGLVTYSGLNLIAQPLLQL